MVLSVHIIMRDKSGGGSICLFLGFLCQVVSINGEKTWKTECSQIASLSVITGIHK